MRSSILYPSPQSLFGMCLCQHVSHETRLPYTVVCARVHTELLKSANSSNPLLAWLFCRQTELVFEIGLGLSSLILTLSCSSRLSFRPSFLLPFSLSLSLSLTHTHIYSRSRPAAFQLSVSLSPSLASSGLG
ncbi:unnamed protein product, partial [Protopolystoma xenopodis]